MARYRGVKLITLVETDAIGCKSDTIKVFVFLAVSLKVFTPTAFTSNNDGLNNDFGIGKPEIFLNYSLKIINRWGIIVFEGNEQNPRWNGLIQGNEATGDMYIWDISGVLINQKKFNQYGTVLLLR